MVSIVMAVRDSLPFTKKGVASILANTQCEFELVIVDNGSGEDTVEFLQGISDPRVRVIRSEENLGCAKGWNLGIRESRGEYVMVANNDIEVPPGWLTRLREVLDSTRAAWVSPCMREGEFDYDFPAFHDQFVRKFGDRIWEGQYRAVALFSKRSLYTEELGMFDESYKFGTYEDEDYYWRIAESGRRSIITGSVLIHHYGGRTVSVQKRKTPKFIKENRRTFHRKWWKIYFRRKHRNRALKAEMAAFEAENGHKY